MTLAPAPCRTCHGAVTLLLNPCIASCLRGDARPQRNAGQIFPTPGMSLMRSVFARRRGTRRRGTMRRGSPPPRIPFTLLPGSGRDTHARGFVEIPFSAPDLARVELFIRRIRLSVSSALSQRASARRCATQGRARLRRIYFGKVCAADRGNSRRVERQPFPLTARHAIHRRDDRQNVRRRLRRNFLPTGRLAHRALKLAA
jgi:hypothetical protein